MAHSPHRRWKGCPTCKAYKFRDGPQHERQPWPAVRFTGKRKRLRRRDLGDRLDTA